MSTKRRQPIEARGPKKPTLRRRAREMLLGGEDALAIAEQIGVAPSTVYRWRRERGFSERLEAAHEARLSMAQDRLKSLVGKALDTLEEVMGDKAAPPASRVKASSEVLDRAGITSKQTSVVITQAVAKLDAETMEAAQRWLDGQKAAAAPSLAATSMEGGADGSSNA